MLKENSETDFSAQGLFRENGEYDWACAVGYPNQTPHDDFAVLQTYIRGERYQLGCPLIWIVRVPTPLPLHNQYSTRMPLVSPSHRQQ